MVTLVSSERKINKETKFFNSSGYLKQPKQLADNESEYSAKFILEGDKNGSDVQRIQLKSSSLSASRDGTDRSDRTSRSFLSTMHNSSLQRQPAVLEIREKQMHVLA